MYPALHYSMLTFANYHNIAEADVKAISVFRSSVSNNRTVAQPNVDLKMMLYKKLG